MKINTPIDYPKVLKELVGKIHEARYRSLRAVNKEVINVYWEIGRTITEKQDKGEWGGFCC
jgi:hypothetical protein